MYVPNEKGMLELYTSARFLLSMPEDGAFPVLGNGSYPIVLMLASIISRVPSARYVHVING